ncbi:MAG TPA: lytic murein transglycosylase [Nocardioides sp.]|nr:lytic murein transglycosylase [Nocardioides sp.]
MSPRAVAAATGGVVLVAVLAAVIAGGALATKPRGLPAAGQQLVVPAPAGGAAPAAPAAISDRAIVSAAWVRQSAVHTGIPEAAVRAYGAAQLQVADDCNIGWTTLAGIGWVESQHGTMGERLLLADGHSSRPILGPALDGAGKFAAVRATADSALLHDDAQWDHAVGPLQFITSTWVKWATDGDRDGRSDPYDIDDAALAAAHYLCASGADFTTGEGWSRAVFSYNHAESYVRAVNVAAATYADRARQG